MCGIAGCVSVRGHVEKESLLAPLASLKHRGPDGEGVWADELCALGQRRLAIIDLNDRALAPLSNEDESVWVTFNGEIYNFQELRQDLEARGHAFKTSGDTEVIVHAYEQWGVDCVERFRGMFAFAIWDQRKKRLFLARDRLGKKPLFYSLGPGTLCFASELQGLLAFPHVSREPDLVAIDSYLSWGYVPAPLSGFVGVRKLEPGCRMTLDAEQGTHAVERYWSLAYLPKAETSEQDAIRELRELLTEAVRLRMISDVPLGAFLSGGLDSSIVVGLMAQLASSPVKTFSIGFDEGDYDELAYARRIAEKWGTDHHEEVVRPDASKILPTLVRHYGEPFADSSAIPTFYVSMMTRREVTVALTGDGGDEAFGGYDRYRANLWAARLGPLPGTTLAAAIADRIPTSKGLRDPVERVARFLRWAHRAQEERYAGWMSYFTREDKQRLYSRAFSDSVSPSAASDWYSELFSSVGTRDPLDAPIGVDVRSYLPFDLLVKVDIAAMASSLETRAPFLDHEVMEYAARLPAGLKVRGRRGKYLARRAFEDMLPTETLARAKRGFGVPVGSWFRGPLKGLLSDALLSQSSLDRGLFDRGEVTRLLGDHLEGRADHSARLWSLLMLELWHREMVDVGQRGRVTA